MESTVEMNAPEVVADGAQAVDAPAAGGAEQNEISVSELLGEGTKAEKVESTGDDSQQPKVSSQKDFDTALSKRLSQENAKGYSRGKSEIENSPEMKYIRAVIDERAQEKGITREQAFRELNEERINARAQRYAKDPASWYRDQMLGQQPQAQAQESPQIGKLTVTELAKQMADAIRANELPEGFDPHKPGDDFFEAAGEYGVKAALRIWKAEHASELKAQADARQIAQEVEKRRNGPKPMSPSGANPAVPREVDFSKMTTKEFLAFEQKIKQAEREGKTVRL